MGKFSKVQRWTKIVLGGITVIMGIILMPVPGPGGFPLAMVGLAILASEIPWARRLIESLKQRIEFFRSRKTSKLIYFGLIAVILCFYIVIGIIVIRIFSKGNP